MTRSILLEAIKARADDRGFVRTTIDELVADTGHSRSTVKRLLAQLVADRLIAMRVKDGHGGGIQIKVSTGSQPVHQPVHQPVQPVQTGHVFDQTPGPEGALGGLIGTSTGSSTGSRRAPAYRPIRPDETPVSNAELAYANDDPNAKWRRLSATLWEAPNGDAASVRSMTPALRLKLRVDENDDGTRNVEAIRAIRGIVE